MEIRMKGTVRSLTEFALSNALSKKRKEEIALHAEATRLRAREHANAIKRAKNQLVTAALMGETRLYLESE